MTGKIKNLVNRRGRYHARLVVPKDLRKFVGKTELRTPLGGDYRQAVKLLPGAVAQLQHKIALAEREAGIGDGTPARYPLATDQLAYNHYSLRLMFDERRRNHFPIGQIGINDLLVDQLRAAVGGHATNEELKVLVGPHIERYRTLGNTDVLEGSPAWRELARALCMADLEALERIVERDEGNFSGETNLPLLKDAEPPKNPDKPVNLTQLWTDYVNSRVQAGFMRDKGKRQLPVIESLRKFVKHNDARRITKRDLLEWRDQVLEDRCAKTVNDVYLSAIRSLFSWAFENERLTENVAASVKQPKARKVYSRERGYTDAEALKVLKASRSYQSKVDEFGNVRESVQIANVKRWVPMICAFSGARVSEIIQLRKQDVTKVEGRWVIRITPDAGTVKSGGYRDIPLHDQIIAEGFPEFVLAAKDGPLFHNAKDPEKFQRAAVIVSNKLSEWLRTTGLRPDGLQPNHAWRHRFKTQCRELGISDRVVDAIQGHAAKTSSDNYGDVTLKTKTNAIEQLPNYDLNCMTA
ncbi:Phage integrase [Sulfitobacter noctilucae]|uniref:site-specific integrase n=1 Tax=Sulfitobacter noctilucae TaxID=1342302 RepID=UPI00046AC136|nr:site-specific integrase [Sulfitobacter noctilucae]KIN60634.1 Phage integrase [Sulfitobacter noctilucae]